MGQQPSQQRLVDLVGGGVVVVAAQALLPRGLLQLGVQVGPLPHPQVVQELALTHPPERAAGQLTLLLTQVAPQAEQDQEVGVDDRAVLPRWPGPATEPGVGLVGLGLLVGRPLPRVLHRQRRDDDQHLAQGSGPFRLDDHPGQARVDRERHDRLAVWREAAPTRTVTATSRRGVDGLQLLEQAHPVGDLPAVRALHEREPGDVAQAEVGHRQDHAGQVGAQDLRLGELRPRQVVLLAVEPDRDAVGQPPAPSGPLVGAGLADRLDRQPLHLEPLAVTADPRRARVHHVADAGDGQRGLGHVGGHHDPAARVAGEDAVLLSGGQPPEQRQHLGLRQPQPFQRLGGVADLALAGAEDQDVLVCPVGWAGLGPQLLDGLADPADLVDVDRGRCAVARGRAGAGERAVADGDRVGASRDLDHRRGRAVGRGEVGREPVHVDRRGGDDDLEVRSSRQQRLEVAQQEVDVEAALVRLVDDEGVVAAQVTVAVQLGEQDPVGHHLDPGVPPRPVGEPHLVSDGGAQLDAELFGDPLGHGPGGDPAGLGVADHPGLAPSELQTDLGQLGGLARAGLARDDHDLVRGDRRGDLGLSRDDGELGREVDRPGPRHTTQDRSPQPAGRPDISGPPPPKAGPRSRHLCHDGSSHPPRRPKSGPHRQQGRGTERGGPCTTARRKHERPGTPSPADHEPPPRPRAGVDCRIGSRRPARHSRCGHRGARRTRSPALRRRGSGCR